MHITVTELRNCKTPPQISQSITNSPTNTQSPIAFTLLLFNLWSTRAAFSLVTAYRGIPTFLKTHFEIRKINKGWLFNISITLLTYILMLMVIRKSTDLMSTYHVHAPCHDTPPTLPKLPVLLKRHHTHHNPSSTTILKFKKLWKQKEFCHSSDGKICPEVS